MPQVTFQPLPVLQEGEELEEEEIEKDINSSVTVNFVTGEDSWILVQWCKKNKVIKDSKNEKWNVQQRQNGLVTYTGVSPIKNTGMFIFLEGVNMNGFVEV